MKKFVIICLCLAATVLAWGAYVYNDPVSVLSSGGSLNYAEVDWSPANDTNLVLYFEFLNETDCNNGIFQDSSGWENNGSNPVGGTRYAVWTNDGGPAMLFDNVNDQIVNAATPSLQITNAITLSCWVNTLADDTGNIIGRDDLGANRDYAMYLRDMGGGASRFSFFIYQGNALKRVTSNVDVRNDNVWYHIAGTFDGSDLYLYVNGQRQSETVNSAGTIDNDTVDVFMGYNGSAYGGMLALPKIHDRALSSNEVAAAYAAGR